MQHQTMSFREHGIRGELLGCVETRRIRAVHSSLRSITPATKFT